MRRDKNVAEVKLAGIPFTSPPEKENDYQVGEVVEVLCDHEDEDGDRVHDWLDGVIVQVDEKLVAVQFPEKVYLTDGWMVPDHVLWYPQDSDSLRRPRKRSR